MKVRVKLEIRWVFVGLEKEGMVRVGWRIVKVLFRSFCLERAVSER